MVDPQKDKETKQVPERNINKKKEEEPCAKKR
jgi:hypothetical protein